MVAIVSEIIWLKWLLEELTVSQTPLFCDNQATLHIAANPVFHEWAKHVKMDCHFVRERVQTSDIEPMKIGTKDQVANIFINLWEEINLSFYSTSWTF